MSCRDPSCKKRHPTTYKYILPSSDLPGSCYTGPDEKDETSEKSDAVDASGSGETLQCKKKSKRKPSSSSSTTTTSLDSENSNTDVTSDSTDSSDSAASSSDSAASSADSSTSSLKEFSTSSSKESSTSSSEYDLAGAQKKQNPVDFSINAKATKTLTGTGPDSTNSELGDSVCTDVNCACNSDNNSTVRNVFFGVTGALVVLMISYLLYIKYKTKSKAKKFADYKELSGEVKI